jgi:hypothetical protein
MNIINAGFRASLDQTRLDRQYVIRASKPE